ncbi:hypothetical protein GT037_008249 [Alternaria burnsii]|uniref:RING-type domain-containing protein n=1 Tax=Alternaria burnsii TaxID=1187904 RepID=A0A8H7AY17_9PLEO|nr:uncharacterized protein GT037_008249 [Alternaria burnsii]KAF7673634.1 hypothetical protein GT037_008249 [Alternaria burnsii]
MSSPTLPPLRVTRSRRAPGFRNFEILPGRSEVAEPPIAPQQSGTMPRHLSPGRSESPPPLDLQPQSTMIPRLEMLPESRSSSPSSETAIPHQDDAFSPSTDLHQDETDAQNTPLRSRLVRLSRSELNFVLREILSRPATRPTAPPPSDNALLSTPPDFNVFLDNNLLPLMPTHPLYPPLGTTCGICHDSFHEAHAPVLIVKAQGCSGHVFGYQCLRKSISADTANSNKCPLCRTTWFEISRQHLTRLAIVWGRIGQVENRVIRDIEDAENDAENARSAALGPIPTLDHQLLIARDWEIGMAIALARAHVADLAVVGDMAHRMEMSLATERERDSEMAAAITRIHATLRPSRLRTLYMAWIVLLHVLLFVLWGNAAPGGVSFVLHILPRWIWG